MKLHDSKMAPNPRRVRIFLAEKAIDVPTVQVDIGAKANLEPGFLALNPLGRVPVLELDDGTCIAESGAICRYFEGQQPDPALMGVDAQDAAVVEGLQDRPPCFQLVLDAVDADTHPFRHQSSKLPGNGQRSSVMWLWKSCTKWRSNP